MSSHSTLTESAEIARHVRKGARMLRNFFRRRSQKLPLPPSEVALDILRAQQDATLEGVLVVDPAGTIISMNARFVELFWLSHDVITSYAELERRLIERIEPEEMPKLAPLRFSEKTEFELRLRDDRVLAASSVPVKAGGEFGGRVWTYRDITETVRANQLRAALFRITEISRTAEDLDELFHSLHDTVGELMDATNFYVAFYDETNNTIEFPIFVDEIDPAPNFPIEARGLTSWVLTHREPLLATPETVEAMLARGEIDDIGAPSVDWLGVPLESGDRVFGVLVVQSYRESVRYGNREKEILMYVSQHIAAAIEQKRREDALRDSENRYRQMFKNNQAVKLVVDPESGDIVDANPAACAFYGWTREELEQKKIWDINTLDQSQVKAAMEMAAMTSQGYFTFRHRLSSGEIRDVEVYSGPIQVGNRQLLYSIIHDITERKRAERALRRSEEHFRSLIENASDMIAILDVQGTIHYTSPSVERVLGFDPKKTVGGNIFDFAHPDDAPVAARALTEAFEGNQAPHILELRVRHSDGTWRHLEGSTRRLEAESGERLVLNCRDVTERKSVEVTLQNQSAAMEASMDGIAILNEKGEFTYVNHAFFRLYGYRNRHDILGQRWTILHHRRGLPRVVRQIIPSFLANGEWRGESTGKTRDRRSFPIEVSLTRIGAGSAVCVVRDITERTLAEEQIKHLAYHDALTGLPNRLLFKDRLIVALSHAQREKSKLAVLFLDLDRFKVINDSLGHDAGDHLLQEVARRIARCVRETDTVSRLGGDEFTILLTGLQSGDDAARIARKVLDSLRAPITIANANRELYVTTSVGIALYPDDGADAETLLKNADTAMYQAKEFGRDNYQLFNAASNARAVERLTLENGLRRAMANHEFTLHYQPIFNLRTGRIHGMESLIRWNDPDRGMISPASFIPIAESTGMMQQIGSWALETACRQARVWHQHGFTNLAIAVNLSVSQLQQPDLVAQVREILETTGLPPRLLELEITESSAMQNPETNIQTLNDLQKLGVRISLDDFGIGHSSLGHLKQFPIDTLKIDQSFIRDTTDSDTGAIVAAIIAMGHTLRLTVVAEGVELEAQRVFLTEKRCDLMQGYLFHPPLPPSEFEAVLIKHSKETGQWNLDS